MIPTSPARNFGQVKEVDAAEVQRLYEGCHTSAYRRTLRQWEFLMKLTQQWLVSESEWAGAKSECTAVDTVIAQKEGPPPLNSLLQVFPSRRFLTGLGSIGRFATTQGESESALHTGAEDDVNARGPKTFQEYFVAGGWFLFTYVVRNCILLKLAIMATLLSRRDYLRSVIEPNLQQNATVSTDGLCVLKEDIHFAGDDLARFKEHEKLTSWLQSLGAGFLSVPGLAALLAGLASGESIMFLVANTIYFRTRRVRVDHLYFIFDPIGERRRIKYELDTLVRELIGSLSERRPPFNWKTIDRGTSSYSLTSRSHRFPRAHQCEQPILSHAGQQLRLEREHYLQLLVRVNRLQLVRPYHVTSEWHRKFVWLNEKLIWLFFSLTYIVGIVLFGCLLAHDLYETARFRVAELACRRWHPNGTQMSMLDQSHLQPLDAEALEVAYGSHDGSVLSLLRLALKVEADSYFSFKRATFMMEILIISLLLCLWTVQSGVIYMAGLLDKIAWLDKLEKDIELAAEESAKLTTTDKRLVEGEEDRFLETLTLAYLHYEIFRRQERAFHVFAHSSLVRVIVMVGTGCSILYSMAFNGKTLNQVVLNYLYFVLFSLVNALLLGTSYKAKQMERIKRKMGQILAHCATSRSLQMSYALELWRRQLLHDHVESDLLGVSVSYDSVIALNAYAVATFLLIIRVVSRAT